VQLVDPEYTVLVKLDKERARPPERFDAFPSTLNLLVTKNGPNLRQARYLWTRR
jgi:hypothetical protein